MEAANVQVRFAQLFPSPTAAIATAVGVGTRGRHLVAGGHIGLQQRETKHKTLGESTGTYMRSQPGEFSAGTGQFGAISATVQRAIKAISWGAECNPARTRRSQEKWYSLYVNTHQYCFLRGMWGLLAATPYREMGPLKPSLCWVTSFLLWGP